MKTRTAQIAKHRRNLNRKLAKYYEEFYKMIDGNYTHYPTGYCTRYKGYLTKGMADVHKCACHSKNNNPCACYIVMERIEKGEYTVCSVKQN